MSRNNTRSSTSAPALVYQLLQCTSFIIPTTIVQQAKVSQTRGGSEREAYFRVPLPTIRIYNLIEILVLAHDANENVNEKL